MTEYRKTATKERARLRDPQPPHGSTSAYLWRDDVALLRYLYRGTSGGFSSEIRLAVAIHCASLRRHLASTPDGKNTLLKLNQLYREPNRDE